MTETEHVHMDGNGDYERDWAGRIRVCFEQVCIEYASRNPKAVDTLGGAVVGAFVGAAIGLMVGRPLAGAAAGGLLGAGTGYAVSKGLLDAPRLNGLPVLGPRLTW